MDRLETTHNIHIGDARSMDELPDDSVELVVTSPPYPMVEMWDDLFADLDPDVADLLAAGDGAAAFDAMHDQLRTVWAELERVLVDGGIACVNVGDATRKIDDCFRVYQNHARVTDAFEDLGFDPLPEVLWRKPANSGAKFLGSGMVPPNAYVTLEHEYVLVFRNGGPRSFEAGAERRYNSAYFWEERNRWFSDVWSDVRGERQTLDHTDLRERSAAFPFEIPHRLVCMYSVYGDTVLDPFWGTGTTGLAAMVAGRNSVGYEVEPAFAEVFDDRVERAPETASSVAAERLAAHREFVAASDDEFAYEAEHYDFPVRTKQERPLRFFGVEDVSETENGYRVVHEPVGSPVTTLERG